MLGNIHENRAKTMTWWSILGIIGLGGTLCANILLHHVHLDLLPRVAGIVLLVLAKMKHVQHAAAVRGCVHLRGYQREIAGQSPHEFAELARIASIADKGVAGTVNFSWAVIDAESAGSELDAELVSMGRLSTWKRQLTALCHR